MRQLIGLQDTIDYYLCPKFEKTFSFLGKKWNGLIIDVLLQEGVLRFREIARQIPKCSDRVLVERLRELEDDGVVVRKEHDDSSLIEYSLTEQGKELAPIMHEIHTWSEKWYPSVKK
ncbi:HTH-type transcriptional regulator YodB [Lentilactobacillus parabuchneri]|jgi:DNA-binding HxlR family transcriptional regulator|uniref:HTH-type transcriptional regulator YodB n=3 Tax=Lentilactobacillus parabuchneri TaxID=152331 RepID=A0A1X1FBE7_9LACO|nr:helix-turn-helix domain-containing protein [Lentilactobacillus parabuchneri]APR08412.1 HTH-type transcriptional regulator YodB [Lentilactobacillus parabuchneri]KRM47926.1 HxlR family transcriptional regulator [Lentilactobacillus parabuchneri DSM 5707 = NBRC 107865]KRN74547.1 HxlR family transcriptional regulator [Lentilactobacillus parabuchneri]MBW0222001.1 helix-turn-helix transcriptional regulator [Lentilactobacillus parabuchneri]MBW0244775.1 helix-turn-helix transcriptional regulator [Le